MSAFPAAEEFAPSAPSSDLLRSSLLQLMTELQDETDFVRRDKLTF